MNFYSVKSYCHITYFSIVVSRNQKLILLILKKLNDKQSCFILNCFLCRQRLFENLRMLPHAPGVQMQAIPEDAVHEDSGDEDGEDPDKRISSK